MSRTGLTTEFVPAQEKGSRRLLVALHGLGDSAAGYRWMPDVFGWPWMNYLLVNAPDAYYGGFSWYDFQGEPRPGIERSRQLVLDVLAKQRAEGWPSEETVLLGFSQGCLMTVDAGFRHPHRLAGLVGVSGYVHEPGELLRDLSPIAREQRMLFTHGTEDPLIPHAAVREQVKELQSAGLNIEWREFRKAHTIAVEEVRVIREFIEKGFAAD